MSELMLIENLSLTEGSVGASFTISAGDMKILLTAKDEVTVYLTKLLIGLIKPISGKISLFSADIATLSARELQEGRRKIGVAYSSGGLVSNLKVWENLTLPLYYHQNLSHEEIEIRGLAILSRLGYTGKLMALPGHLGVSQKKLVGCARAMIIDPDVIIYESPLTGLSHEEINVFFRVAREFHGEKLGRASVFVTSSQEVIRSLPEAIVVNLTEGQSS